MSDRLDIPEEDAPTVIGRVSPRMRTARNASASGGGYGDDDPTIVMPSAPPLSTPQDGGGGPNPLENISLLWRQIEGSEHTLTRAASSLLLLVAHLRNAVERADIVQLRRQVVEEIERFQTFAQNAGVASGDVVAARYVLCSVVDETVLMTPWGSRSEWSTNSLLYQYHKETWGGEKVFEILDRIKEDPKKWIQLLHLIFVCLQLGFEGRYRVIDRGRDQLEDLRLDLARIIRQNTAIKKQPLSGIVAGTARGRRVSTFVPIWVVSVVTVLTMTGIYFYADLVLADLLEPVKTRLSTIMEI